MRARAQTVGILRYLSCLVLGALAVGASAAPARAQTVGELPRAGAPRPLNLVGPDGLPLNGSPSDAAWERGGGGLFFTLEREGTRNIWRAFPDPQDAARFPVWRALPVTDLRAPRYAARPCPLPGNRALVCVSNALGADAARAQTAQIVRYDLPTAQFRALSDGVRLYDAPQVSPDGARVAFAGGQGAEARVFVASTRNPQNRVLPDVTPLIANARRPIWLDDDNLLVENLAPDARGLYRLRAQSLGVPRVVVGGGGEAGTLGTNGIVFSAKTAAQAPPNLYVVARDGSGLRVLNETAGARHPASAPDGLTLAYDAPLNGQRALWVVPLVRAESRVARAQMVADSPSQTPSPYEVPTAQLLVARAAPGGIAVVGTLRGAANSTIKLEVGEGEKPRRWETLPVAFPPVSPLLDTAGNRVLTTWNPPPRARGMWTLRLSLSGLGGGAQSLLRVRLPLPAEAPAPVKPAPPRVETPALEPLPRATPLPAPPDFATARDSQMTPPVTTSPNADDDDLPAFPPMQTPEVPLGVTPIAPFSNAPIPPAIPDRAPDRAPTTAGASIVPIDPTRLDTPVAPVSDDGNYGDAPVAPAGEPWVAQFNVSGTPARIEPGGKTKVTFWVLNRGTASWETGASGENRVRLVARWVDFATGARRQWNYFWLDEAVAPGERAKREVELPVPSRPGKYKLIYGLVRLPASGEYMAPSYNAPQESWDDEFGAIAFAIEVANAQ